MSATLSELVTVERAGRIAHVQLNRPEKLNALNSALVGALTSAFVPFNDDRVCSVIVVSGAGRSFSAGADVRELHDLDEAKGRAFIRALHELLRTIRDLPQVVIAAVHGYCFGGAAELVASCDIRIGAESARFGMPEIKVGIPSVIEAALFVPLVGLGRAADLVLSGDEWDATAAERYGLITRIVANDDLLAAADRLARQICAYSGPALRTQKQLVRMWAGEEVDRAVEQSIGVFAESFRSPNPREALTALLAKRPPRFSEL